jgi:hypothetical protein
MHGGADGSGAPSGSRNGNYKHGRFTKEVAATRQWLREAIHMLRGLNVPDDGRNHNSAREWEFQDGERLHSQSQEVRK